MIFINPNGLNTVRKMISYALIGAGVVILLFPKFIGLLLAALGCILLSEQATNYAIKAYKKIILFLIQQQP